MSNLGHNSPPNPIDEITAHFEAERLEAENWLDGTPVENEAQMNAVDTLRKAMRQWRLDLEKGQKSASAPIYDTYKAELARWKPTIDDAKRIEAGLVSAVDGFKRILAERKRAEERKAWEAAEQAKREAAEKAAQAAASDIEAQREAAAAQEAAMAAEKAAQAARKDNVKGMRTVYRYEIKDHRAALHWIAQNDRDAMTAFIEAYVAKNHKDTDIAGVRRWTEKQAF